jgi:TonB-linked SusC/RagA family outer membrane protein
MNTNLETSINYTKSFSKHNFDVLVNASTQRFKNDFEDMSYSNLEKVDALRRNNITNQAPYTKAFAFFDRSAVQGYLGRLNYNFDNKYYLDATVRRDGSSKFDKDYRWGTFPAVSGAWRISSEKFMSDLTFINDLKIRGGWGQLGNQETAAYKFLSTVNGGSDYAFGSGTGTTGSSGVPISGSTLLDFPVIDLSWETAETSNYGFDGTFFNNRLTFSAEYYTRLVKGILQSAGLAASIGNQVSPVLNIANVGNRGVELQTSYSGKVGEFGYNVGGNITTVRNRVLKVYQSNPFGGEVNSSRADQLRIEVGHPLFSYWGYEVGGIFQNQAEIDEWRKTNSDGINGNKFAPGDMWFKDVARAPLAGEGNQPIQEQDGKIDVNDRKILGKSIAGYYYGFNFGANWKNFDLSTFFQGVGDVQRYNAIRQQGEQMSSNGVNQWTTTLNRWTPQNPSTTIPRAVNGDPAQNNRPSSRFLENSSYLRLKNVQLGYNLPSNLKKRLGFVDNLRIYAAGINLFTATQWTGLDPENDNVPPTRSFMFGLNANF